MVDTRDQGGLTHPDRLGNWVLNDLPPMGPGVNYSKEETEGSQEPGISSMLDHLNELSQVNEKMCNSIKTALIGDVPMPGPRGCISSEKRDNVRGDIMDAIDTQIAIHGILELITKNL